MADDVTDLEDRAITGMNKIYTMCTRKLSCRRICQAEKIVSFNMYVLHVQSKRNGNDKITLVNQKIISQPFLFVKVLFGGLFPVSLNSQ